MGVEQEIMKGLVKLFRLTDDTPLMRGRLRKLIGLFANNKSSEKIL